MSVVPYTHLLRHHRHAVAQQCVNGDSLRHVSHWRQYSRYLLQVAIHTDTGELHCGP